MDSSSVSMTGRDVGDMRAVSQQFARILTCLAVRDYPTNSFADEVLA